MVPNSIIIREAKTRGKHADARLVSADLDVLRTRDRLLSQPSQSLSLNDFVETRTPTSFLNRGEKTSYDEEHGPNIRPPSCQTLHVRGAGTLGMLENLPGSFRHVRSVAAGAGFSRGNLSPGDPGRPLMKRLSGCKGRPRKSGNGMCDEMEIGLVSVPGQMHRYRCDANDDDAEPYEPEGITLRILQATVIDAKLRSLLSGGSVLPSSAPFFRPLLPAVNLPSQGHVRSHATNTDLDSSMHALAGEKAVVCFFTQPQCLPARLYECSVRGALRVLDFSVRLKREQGVGLESKRDPRLMEKGHHRPLQFAFPVAPDNHKQALYRVSTLSYAIEPSIQVHSSLLRKRMTRYVEQGWQERLSVSQLLSTPDSAVHFYDDHFPPLPEFERYLAEISPPRGPKY
ncbi:uncharacterized protein CLUP02_09900 [Colletotrichum lupini]|uniref:Uncharacterized protein n=1 Tax=Colletotrichum lupini TaxID=145971 RepID=A0A9Q8SVU6_9PEZI|nr:uncharacterized protein CLUP02_09900 [Colletotrichum lupini]UQC84403.1 hypothetical protein CLUP02_09900 [Colletotrichum lupini]